MNATQSYRDPHRNTGRTERMLRAVAEAAQGGARISVYAHRDKGCLELGRRFVEQYGYRANVRFFPLLANTVDESTTEDLGKTRFVDHAAIAKLNGPVLQELHRYDRPEPPTFVGKAIEDNAKLEKRVAMLEADRELLRERLYGARELWCEHDSADARKRAQSEAAEHGVPCFVNAYGVRVFKANPPRIPELEAENAKLREDAEALDERCKSLEAEADMRSYGIDEERALREENAELDKENRQMKADIQEAAGELLVPLPSPGTVEAKLLSANVIMRKQVADLNTKWAAVESEIEYLEEHVHFRRRNNDAPIPSDRREFDAYTDGMHDAIEHFKSRRASMKPGTR